MNLTQDEKEQLAEENYRYIHYFAKKYHSPQWNYDDLAEAASFGMAKALNTFDKEKGIKFSTYSARCMINEIIYLMRNDKKHLNNISIDKPIRTDKGEKELTILDTLYASEKELDWREISPVVNSVLAKLPEQKRKILLLFFDDMNQREIGKLMGFSQANISRTIAKALKQIKEEYWKSVADVSFVQEREIKIPQEEKKNIQREKSHLRSKSLAV